MLLLQTLSIQNSYIMGSFIALLFGILLLLFLLLTILWLYMSFAYMALAKKNKQQYPALAWIPLFGPAIIAFRSHKNHHWLPWLLLVGVFFPVVDLICFVAFIGFVTYWNWDLFEAVNKPGWWSIFMILPMGNIAFLALLGVAAWSKDETPQKKSMRKSMKKRTLKRRLS